MTLAPPVVEQDAVSRGEEGGVERAEAVLPPYAFGVGSIVPVVGSRSAFIGKMSIESASGPPDGLTAGHSAFRLVAKVAEPHHECLSVLRRRPLLSSELDLHVDEPSFESSLDSKVDEPVGHLGRDGAEIGSEHLVDIALALFPFEDEGAENLGAVAMGCTNPVWRRRGDTAMREAVRICSQLQVTREHMGAAH